MERDSTSTKRWMIMALFLLLHGLVGVMAHYTGWEDVFIATIWPITFSDQLFHTCSQMCATEPVGAAVIVATWSITYNMLAFFIVLGQDGYRSRVRHGA